MLKLKKILKKCFMHIRRTPLRAALCVFMALVLMFCGFMQNFVFTYADDEVESLEDELEQAQEAADELEDEIDEAEDAAAELEDEIDSLNDELASLSDDIEALNTEITQKEEEIAALEAEIAAMEEEIAAYEAEIAQNEEAAEKQYASLLSWIQVSYENNFDSLFLSIMAAESFYEVISTAEYVQSLSDFGIDLIERYNSTLETLNAQKEALEEEKAALKAQQADLNESLAALSELEDETVQKKAEVSSVISQTQDSLEDLEDTIDSLEEELAAQQEYEAELELEKAMAEAARAAEIALEEAALEDAEAVVSTDSGDLILLAALIYCEAGGESYTGQVAVGCVVMNRVRSSSFPNTVSGVIYQSGQFTPVTSGRLATTIANNLTSDSCYEAAEYVLAGNLPYSEFLYFCSASIDLGISTTVIGNHQFY